MKAMRSNLPAMRRIRSSRKGFTLVEFMVATVVFSIVMLLTSYAITSMSRMYQRSMNTSRAQATARALVDTIAQSVQFSSTDIQQSPIPPSSTTPSAYCIGQKQFIFIPGRKVGTNGGTDTRHAVVSRTSPGGAVCDFASINITTSDPAGTVDMVGSNMRVAALDVTQSAGLITVHAKVVYGTDDLLENPTTASAKCLAGHGSEYCAVSELSTVVQRRIN